MEQLVDAATSALASQGAQPTAQHGAPAPGGGFDLAELVSAATSAHTSGTMDASAFSSIATAVLSKHSGSPDGRADGSDSDEDEEAWRARDRTVQAGESSVSSRDIGASAAMSAFKSVFGGSSGSGGGAAPAPPAPSAGAGGDLQSQLIGVAMAHASDLFESKQAQGLLASASKNEAVQQAGEMVAKMLMKQQLQNSGGLGALAAKFM